MLAELNTLPTITSNILLMVVVFLLKALLTHFLPHSPLAAFRFYCRQLANKVNRSTNSASQQSIAGFVAITVTLLPLIIILWLFEDFTAVPWLWHGLLLYLALDGFEINAKSKILAQALVSKQSYLAKQTLQPNVLRTTQELSPMGLCKANIEMQLLRFFQYQIVIIFYFLLIGPLFSLAVRLLIEMHQQWNPKQENFKNFGKASSFIANLLQWLPSKCLALIILLTTLQQNFILHWRLSKRAFFANNNNMLIHSFSLALGVQLAGVAIYNGSKLRRTAFNEQSRQPEIRDIIHASRLIRGLTIFILLFCATLAILQYLFI